MDAAFERLNGLADHIDGREERSRRRRAEAAAELRARCAPFVAVHALAAPPAPAAVPELSALACAVLGLVAHFVSCGHAGLQIGAEDLADVYRRSIRAIWYALAELRQGAWLRVTPDYVPAELTAIGGPYVTRRGPGRRCVPSDAPGAYSLSRIRNLYTLGTKAREMGFGQAEKGCGEAARKCPESGLCIAIASGVRKVSGDPEGLLDPDRACDLVDKSIAANELELASSPPPVADPIGDFVELDGGDAGGNEGRVRRRGLWARIGWRVRRFFRGGDS